MLHIQSFPWRARERTVGWFAFVLMSMALVALASQTTQWFRDELRSGDARVTSASGARGLATSSYVQMPMAMTIPYGIAQAQHEVVAKMRRSRKSSFAGSRHANTPRHNLTGLNGARRLIAGLAVAQALGSAH